MSLTRASSTGSGAPPSPLGRSLRKSSTHSQASPSFSGRRISASLGSLPPPPPGISAQTSSSYSQSIAKSMTIEEMRQLHQRALRDAESKRMELRLVLASRYRELVGSSDEVIKMNERSQELHDLVFNLPALLEKLAKPAQQPADGKDEEKLPHKDDELYQIRHNLSLLPRLTHRALDVNDVHKATITLIEVFRLIASLSDEYPLANSLAPETPCRKNLDPALGAQIRMIYLQLQTVPQKIERIASKSLLRAASFGKTVDDPAFGAYHSAAALVSLHLLAVKTAQDQASSLLDLYFDSKAKLLVSLLKKLHSPNPEEDYAASTVQAEEVLSKIVLVLQYDALLHPYQIFVLRNFPSPDPASVQHILQSLPVLDKSLVRAKCSKFMASHLPLIRSKVKSVLISIAGTTASALGQIRQSLYDRTDGAQSIERINANGVCTWDEAVETMVDVRAVLNRVDTSNSGVSHRFSLWNALFSTTFSSLVHSLLTTSFQSVHSRVVHTLRTSLVNAPPATSILPHEAYRNTLQIASDLNRSLLKVSADAHELLVHAEERIESERRLKESLYVHSCEILGRLVCELRRLVFGDDHSEATKELIVGRLCYLLKFRLTALPTLLDPASSPASMQSTTGMISYVDLHSAFELADDDEDGVISFEEALQAVESAFSGTQFHGAEMVRETLLLSSKENKAGAVQDTPKDVTLDELVLLTARGLRHETKGVESALGAFQRSLDKIVDVCFNKWADAILEPSSKVFQSSLHQFVGAGRSTSESEWTRLYHGPEPVSVSAPPNVSAYLVGFMLTASAMLSCNTCPSDSLPPAPSIEYASALGIMTQDQIPTLMHTLRWAILRRSLSILAPPFVQEFDSLGKMETCCPSFLVQLMVDVSFVSYSFFQRNHNGLGPSAEANAVGQSIQGTIQDLCEKAGKSVEATCGTGALKSLEAATTERHIHVLDASDLFFASLFSATKASVSPAGEIVGSTTISGSGPLFHMPLTSSRRFALLPVPADRTLSEIQQHGKYSKDNKEEVKNRHETTSGNMVSSSFGFLSSMLKNR